jgi:hypothetical protein
MTSASRARRRHLLEEAAREVVRRLSFETGFYSRCWEISSAHLTADAGRFLADLADIATPTLFCSSPSASRTARRSA